ncbi:MAG: C-type lectin domain-containing protein [Planctomycetota bacterium]|jgi:hypothetical protein
MKSACILFLIAGVAPASAQVTVLDVEVNPANGHTYMLLSESNWTDAEAAAVALGGHLVTVSDAAENTWVFSTFGNWSGQARDLWIGFTDEQTEGIFLWTSGQSPIAYFNWSPGQPDNNMATDPSGEQYVHMYGSGSQYGPGQWNDIFDADPGAAPWSFGLYGVVEIETPTSLGVTGTCPGPMTIQVTGLTPLGPVALVTSGTGVGSQAVSAGGCVGLVLDLDLPTLRVVMAADANGDLSLPVNVPAGLCGTLLQAVDVGSCQVTNVVPLL